MAEGGGGNVPPAPADQNQALIMILQGLANTQNQLVNTQNQLVQIQQRGARGYIPSFTFGNEKGEDWLSFRRRIAYAIAQHNCNEEQSKRALYCSMRGNAARAVSNIDPEDPLMTFQQMIEAFERRFIPPAVGEMAISQFETAVQQQKEDVLDFHSRLRDLWIRAYDDPNEQRLIRRFAIGLRNSQIRLRILRGAPADYNAALELALNEASIQHIEKASHSNFPMGNHDEPMEIDAIMKGRTNHSINAVNKKTFSNNNGSNLGSNNFECHYCKMKGHYKRDCRKWSRDQKTGKVSPSNFSNKKRGKTSSYNKTGKRKFVGKKKYKKAFVPKKGGVHSLEGEEGEFIYVTDSESEDEDDATEDESEDVDPKTENNDHASQHFH